MTTPETEALEVEIVQTAYLGSYAHAENVLRRLQELEQQMPHDRAIRALHCEVVHQNGETMATGYEVQQFQDISRIERHLDGIEKSLDRIATVLEAREKRETAQHAVEGPLAVYPPEVQEQIARILFPGLWESPQSE